MKQAIAVLLVIVSTISANAQTCEYELINYNIFVPATHTEYSISLDTEPGCSWSVMENGGWVNILNNVGSGPDDIDLQFSENTGQFSRYTNIIVNHPNGSESASFTQLAAGCNAIALSPGSGYVPYTENSYIFNVIANDGCAWTAVESCPWVTLSTNSGTGMGYITATFATNQGNERTCTITVNGEPFTLTQGPFGNACTYTLSSNSAIVDATSNNYSMNITTSSNCSWTVSENCNWVDVSPTSGTGSSTVYITYPINFDQQGRICNMMIAGQLFIFTQGGTGGSGTGVEETALANLTIYPNPTTGILNLSFELMKEENISLQAYNMLGQTVYAQNTGRQSGDVTQQIALPNTAKGIYLLQLTVGDKVITKRFVVE